LTLKILWICTVWPEPTSSAAGFRTVSLFEALRENGHSVTITSPAKTNIFRSALEQSGFETEQVFANNASFDHYISEKKPDVVIFDRFMTEEQFSWRVRLCLPQATRILDTVDLHSLRRLREKHVKQENFNSTSALGMDTSNDTLRELAAIWRSDLTLVTSTTELELLLRVYGVAPDLLTLCSFGYPLPKKLIIFGERKDLIFIGNFNHEPNIDAVHFLRDSLWAEIRNASARFGVSDCELHIYGAYIPQRVKELDSVKERFRIKGWASNAHEVLSHYRVNLAPLRFGAGIKGKVSDGWYVGTPCVGTTYAAEGMHGELPFGGLVADQVKDFAQAVAQLYTEESLWNQAQENGIKIIKNLFSLQETNRRFVASIEQSHQTQEQLRAKNFIGALLWYQTNRSTEYFSRWIECKNKSGRV